MFNLEQNTTPELCNFIIDNNIDEKVYNNMSLCPFNYNHDGIIYYSFDKMFDWDRSPQGYYFWENYEIKLTNPKFKFLH